MAFHFSELVGRYRLQVTDELIEFIERAFVAPAAPGERERVRRETLGEARAAELEIFADGTIVSRAGTREFYRVRTTPGVRTYEQFQFEKAPGMPVSLVLEGSGRLFAHQPTKPIAEFERCSPEKKSEE
ncbi:MAG TPA: hypothetical protein VFZ53_08570 [Polyangiaceae bacterium]